MTSAFATIEAGIRFAGSTEYSALAFLIALVCSCKLKGKTNVTRIIISVPFIDEKSVVRFQMSVLGVDLAK